MVPDNGRVPGVVVEGLSFYCIYTVRICLLYIMPFLLVETRFENVLNVNK